MSEVDNLIEATMTGVHFDREKMELRIEVSCVWGEGKKRMILSSGIDNLLIDDFRAYNIIDHLTFFAAQDAVLEINECSSALFYLMQKRELTQNDLQWPAFVEKLATIRTGKLQLMEIEPVSGASVLVLAEQIKIEVIGTPGTDETSPHPAAK
jgi:hypothetical protein